MGTNYYMEFDKCPCCGERKDSIHIGKSSAGWCFSLHVYPENNINTLDDWVGLLLKTVPSQAVIKDEYGDEETIIDMVEIIKNRSFPFRPAEDIPYGYSSWEECYRLNHAEPGPNNLMRHKVDGTHCIGHGEGTWDYIVGEFS